MLANTDAVSRSKLPFSFGHLGVLGKEDAGRFNECVDLLLMTLADPD